MEQKNLKELETLCCQQAVPNVIIATTMWSEVQVETGGRREEELRASFWKDMVANGCRIERFEDTYKSAWQIIGSLSDKAKMQVLVPREEERKERKERLAEEQREAKERPKAEWKMKKKTRQKDETAAESPPTNLNRKDRIAE